MAGELISFGIQNLWNLLSQECELFQGVEDQVTELKRDLNLLSSFLKDADAKKHTSAVVKNCVEEIKEIIYDGEDTIETFVLEQKLGNASGIKKSIRRLACIIPDRRRYALGIGGLSNRISKVIRDMKSFGVQQIITDGGYMQPQGDRQREMRQRFSKDDDSDFVGLEVNVKKLVGYLVDEANVQVVSITGMGGLGKTTLAKQVFNHEDVKHQFDGLSWVCVSQDFTRMNVWKKILKDLKPKEEEMKIMEMTQDTLQSELIRLLETSKSLIVLDDIWEKEDWELIKPIFPPTKGWKVLLTSRNESVAMRRNTSYINFKPECLTTEDSWTLFQRIALPMKDAAEFKIDEEKEELGKLMIKHCGGLPLAIKVLGGLLAEKYTSHDWRRLSENIGSHIVGGRTNFNDDNNNTCNYVLSLSFEELPSYLKHCFLYLAHFPEDYKIKKEYSNLGITMERPFEMLETATWTSWWNMAGSSFTRLELLRVLDLMAVKITGWKLASCIGKLIHLRYLSLKHAKVTHIPYSLGNMKLLIYLNLVISVSGSTLVPNVLKEMQQLRYLALPKYMGRKTKLELSNLVKLESLKNFSTKNCSLEDLRESCRLEEDPMPILEKLLQLKELELGFESFSGKKMVCSSCGFPQLQKLSMDVLEKWEEWIVEESSMPLLHTLHIKVCPKLKKLPDKHLPSHLTAISLSNCGLEEDPMPTLERLFHLKVLEFHKSFGGRIMVCAGSGFPQLQELSIKELEEWEEWIVEQGSMPLLHTLNIDDCPNLKELPDGLRFIYSLKNLKVSKRWKKRLSEGGEDYYKVQHIPTVIFY
uniref:Utative disease resistance protein n=2 Tax=Arabidopsis thaliana TaxID=3702 RepID=B5BRD5_ARATH|nr:utative disease resistance protein [Arabidopsis thaliana]